MMIVQLPREALEICYRNAKKSCLGGVSRIYTEKKERMQKLFEDQFVGHIGNAAGSQWYTGNIEAYKEACALFDENPGKGDGGQDLPGLNIDFKTSLMRRSKDPLDYNLLVRPRERHHGWIYVLCMIAEVNMDAICRKIKAQKFLNVYLVGWYLDYLLPEFPASSGPFQGAYAVQARQLYKPEACPKNDPLFLSHLREQQVRQLLPAGW